MSKIKTSFIVSNIYSDFGKVYKAANPFIDSGKLWNFCIETISDPQLMACIAFANDLEIPPVKSLVTVYKRKYSPDGSFVFSEQERKDMGALMGFVFKNVLGYGNQKERCAVNLLGVKTATRFFDGRYFEFEQ